MTKQASSVRFGPHHVLARKQPALQFKIRFTFLARGPTFVISNFFFFCDEQNKNFFYFS